MALDIRQLEGRSPTKDILGYTPDISAYSKFDWYQPVWYLKPDAHYPHQKKVLGHWIGVAESCSNLMAYRILEPNGKVVVR